MKICRNRIPSSIFEQNHCTIVKMSPRRRARSETPESDFEWSQVLKKGFTTSPRQYPRKQTRSTLKIEDQSPSKKRGLVTPPTQSPSKKTGFTTPLTPSPTKRNRSVLDHEYQPPAKRIRLALAAEKEDADHWRKYGPHSGTYRYVRSFSFKQNVPMPQYRLTGENQKAWQTAMGAFYAKANVCLMLEIDLGLDTNDV